MSRSISSYLLVLAIGLALVLTLRSTFRADIVDDAYITMTVVENFVRGGGLHFNPEDRDFVLTTLLWPLFQAALHLAGVELPQAVRLLGALFDTVLFVVVAGLARELTSSWAAGFVAAVLLVTNPVYLLSSLGGMETPLALSLIAAACLFELRGRWTASLVLGALAVLARFDALLFFAVQLTFFAVDGRRRGGTRRWASAAPALALLAAYLLFNWTYFGSPVPDSVMRKLRPLGSTSESYVSACWTVGKQFLKAAIGQSAYWFTAWTPLVLLLPFLALQLGRLWVRRERLGRLRLLVAFSLLHAAAFTLSGRVFAVNFPWYYVPPLLCLSILTAWGMLQAWDALARLVPLGRGGARGEFLAGAAWIALWSLAMARPIEKDTRRVHEDFFACREMQYAAAALWAGRVIPTTRPLTLAAHEIGAVGFYARPDAKILDLYGLARPRSARGTDYTGLMRPSLPEVAIIKFEGYRRGIDEAFPEQYRWKELEVCRGRFPRIWIGLRRDVAEEYRWNDADFMELYASLPRRTE